MLELYDREECPNCTKVRRFLAQQDLSYVLHPVPRLHSERAALLAMPSLATPEVPVLVDGEHVVQGSEAILAYLGENSHPSSFGDPKYGITRKLRGVAFSDVIPRVKEALAAEGFGVLTEIDVKATLKKKLDIDTPHYIILGACNPSLAHQAMTAEPAVGLLLPCNVVVAEDSDGGIAVSAIDPRVMLSVLGNDAVNPMAVEVKARLSRVLAAIEL